MGSSIANGSMPIKINLTQPSGSTKTVVKSKVKLDPRPTFTADELAKRSDKYNQMSLTNTITRERAEINSCMDRFFTVNHACKAFTSVLRQNSLDTTTSKRRRKKIRRRK